MCGICFICSSSEITLTDSDTVLLNHRGPDLKCHLAFNLSNKLHCFMQGCVLHLRGSLTPQPITDSSGNALLWNGEIFGGIHVDADDNDTKILFDQLINCSADKEILLTLQEIHGPWAFIYWQADAKKLWFGRDIFGRRSLLWHLPQELGDNFVLSSVALGDQVFTEIPSVGIFCMDLSSQNTSADSINPNIHLYPWQDCVWPGTTHRVKDTPIIELTEKLCGSQTGSLIITLNDQVDILTSWIPEFNSKLPDPEDLDEVYGVHSFESGNNDFGEILEVVSKRHGGLDILSDKLIEKLEEAVHCRVCNVPEISHSYQRQSHNIEDGKAYTVPEERSGAKVAILFSGGLDSTVLAALSDRCLPPDEPIDLLNVAFEQVVNNKNPSKGTKQYRKKKQPNCQLPCKSSDAESVDDSVSLSAPVENENPSLPKCDISSLENAEACELLCKEFSNINHVTNACRTSHHMSQDLAKRIENLPDQQPACVLGANDTLTTVDSNSFHRDHSFGNSQNKATSLINEGHNKNIDSCISCEEKDVKDCVAGASNSVLNAPNSFSMKPVPDAFNVPDRLTGRIALEELNPKRKWNFVEINVTQEELRTVRESHIRRLISPLQTVLDDSIGCAVWFAARGVGVLANDRNQPFMSCARVILCGMAADEQFAGYSRHRVTFQKSGWAGLVEELKEELWRISARNLGRDDRIITDHGKESRFPYLDENFTKFVSEIPVYQRANLNLPRGVGEKFLLRLAALKLKLPKTAGQPKRAIQFGSKIAKLDNKKEKGSDVCFRLS